MAMAKMRGVCHFCDNGERTDVVEMPGERRLNICGECLLAARDALLVGEGDNNAVSPAAKDVRRELAMAIEHVKNVSVQYVRAWDQILVKLARALEHARSGNVDDAKAVLDLASNAEYALTGDCEVTGRVMLLWEPEEEPTETILATAPLTLVADERPAFTVERIGELLAEGARGARDIDARQNNVVDDIFLSDDTRPPDCGCAGDCSCPDDTELPCGRCPDGCENEPDDPCPGAVPVRVGLDVDPAGNVVETFVEAPKSADSDEPPNTERRPSSGMIEV